jgi:hypothetical protein
MLRSFALSALLITLVATPLAAQGSEANEELLERRLRACLVTGAPGAPKDSLMTAILALRSLCHTQIRRVEDARLEKIDRSFGLPDARLTASERNSLDRERDLARRELAREIAVAVSTFTGLTG